VCPLALHKWWGFVGPGGRCRLIGSWPRQADDDFSLSRLHIHERRLHSMNHLTLLFGRNEACVLFLRCGEVIHDASWNLEKGDLACNKMTGVPGRVVDADTR
jgi:hypothetical protein